jgi:cytosine/adenosine deaminase-related metal-dependent hydrolase
MSSARVKESLDSVILPGLVNAHVHLELSWMRGAVPSAASMPAWTSQMMHLRKSPGPEAVEAIAHAIREARGFGTSVFGDVTNTLASYEPLATSDSSAMVFFEQLGFSVEDPERRVLSAQARLDALPRVSRVRTAVVPHAPYSVSPALLREIARLDAPVRSIHLAESAEEVRFLDDGSGAWRQLLHDLDVWDRRWTPPGCGPVEYIARAGLLNQRLLAVHGVHLTDAELQRLASAGATVVACPRSNLWTGAGTPPVERFYASGVRVAVGTDSLASVADLNVFSELAALRAAAPRVPAPRLLESATRVGAAALGFGDELGSIVAGGRADLIAVRLPGDVADVEEYLVGGIPSADIRWLNGE